MPPFPGVQEFARSVRTPALAGAPADLRDVPNLRPDADILKEISYQDHIMPRITLDIDDVVLQELRALQERDGRSMSAIVSELLAEALARRRTPADAPRLKWVSKPMLPLVDLADTEALYGALDRDAT